MSGSNDLRYWSGIVPMFLAAVVVGGAILAVIFLIRAVF